MQEGGGKEPKEYMVEYVVKDKVVRKELLEATDEIAKVRCMELYKEEKRM